MSSTTEAMEEKNDYTEKSFIYQIFFSSETNGYYIIALVIFYVPLSLYKKNIGQVDFDLDVLYSSLKMYF